MTKAKDHSSPWVVVAPDGVQWLGYAADEAAAWQNALGWPDAEGITKAQGIKGWYAARATVAWREPD